MLAYRKLLFEHYPNFREGIFNGKIISNKSEKIKYKLDLPTDDSFTKVHGQISINYIVDKKNKVVLLEDMEPKEIFLDTSNNQHLERYKGVLVSKSHTDKDIFKINLLNMIENKPSHTSTTYSRAYKSNIVKENKKQSNKLSNEQINLKKDLEKYIDLEIKKQVLNNVINELKYITKKKKYVIKKEYLEDNKIKKFDKYLCLIDDELNIDNEQPIYIKQGIMDGYTDTEQNWILIGLIIFPIGTIISLLFIIFGAFCSSHVNKELKKEYDNDLQKYNNIKMLEKILNNNESKEKYKEIIDKINYIYNTLKKDYLNKITNIEEKQKNIILNNKKQFSENIDQIKIQDIISEYKILFRNYFKIPKKINSLFTIIDEKSNELNKEINDKFNNLDCNNFDDVGFIEEIKNIIKKYCK